MPDVTMPRLSDSMEEGTIVKWLVADGDRVTVGQELAEVETDKATMPLEAEAEGPIELLVEPGATVALGTVIARIGPTAAKQLSRTADEPRSVAAPAQREAPPDPIPAGASAVREGPLDPAPSRAAATAPSERPKASPLARRVAAALSIDLQSLTGSGPRGRIVRADVERVAAAPPAAAPLAEPAPAAAARADGQAKPPAQAAETARGAATVVELSRTQQVIARRMAESRATVPDFTVAMDVDMEAAVALREQLKDHATTEPPPSLNDVVVMACARTLAEQPNVNGAYRDGTVERFARVNVGMAIATPDALVVATVFDADRRSLGSIARATRELAAKVRDGSVTPPELAGATFTVSNLGMLGVDSFTAVVNAPQAAILAVGAVRQRAVAHEGELALRRTMTITLSADHRVLYGADAARFLARVRDLLEQPLGLLAG